MKQPIGIFDSGLGGLTVMAEVTRLLPHEDIIYFGDTAHVPYGSKSRETVTRYSLSIAAFLRSKNVKMIVVACNTASAYALPALKRQLPVPVIGVIDPGARAAAAVTKSGRIGVIGTEGTVRSGSYARAIAAASRTAAVVSRPCPLFVPLVEEGWLDHPVTRSIAAEYLARLGDEGVDALVLGCTHYPLLKAVIADTVGPGISLIDSAEATAAAVRATLDRLGIAATRGKGRHRFYVSDAPQKFQQVGERFLGYPIAPVRKVDLEEAPAVSKG